MERVSAARRVNAERISLFGWGRAILLQLAHPLVAAGVHAHSSFRARPWSAAARLHHTVHAMLMLTFGSDDERQRTIDDIRAIHRRVNGALRSRVGAFATGTPYSADDPALLLWVHVTLLDSVPLIYERIVTPLSNEERDEYCAEAAPIAIALGARVEDVPVTWAALQETRDRIYGSGVLTVGPEAHEVARAVMYPGAGWLTGPMASMNRAVTFGLLPPQIRAEYGVEWTPRDERRCATALTRLRALRRVAPKQCALWKEARR